MRKLIRTGIAVLALYPLTVTTNFYQKNNDVEESLNATSFNKARWAFSHTRLYSYDDGTIEIEKFNPFTGQTIYYDTDGKLPGPDAVIRIPRWGDRNRSVESILDIDTSDPERSSRIKADFKKQFEKFQPQLEKYLINS